MHHLSTMNLIVLLLWQFYQFYPIHHSGFFYMHTDVTWRSRPTVCEPLKNVCVSSEPHCSHSFNRLNSEGCVKSLISSHNVSPIAFVSQRALSNNRPKWLMTCFCNMRSHLCSSVFSFFIFFFFFFLRSENTGADFLRLVHTPRKYCRHFLFWPFCHEPLFALCEIIVHLRATLFEALLCCFFFWHNLKNYRSRFFARVQININFHMLFNLTIGWDRTRIA